MTDPGKQDPPKAPDPPGEPDRIDRVEAKVDALVSKIDGLLDGTATPPKDSRGSEGSTASGGPTSTDPASIGEQVQAELAKVKAQNEADAKAKGDSDWRAGVDEKLKKIPEQTPREPVGAVRRVAQRILGAGEYER